MFHTLRQHILLLWYSLVGKNINHFRQKRVQNLTEKKRVRERVKERVKLVFHLHQQNFLGKGAENRKWASDNILLLLLFLLFSVKSGEEVNQLWGGGGEGGSHHHLYHTSFIFFIQIPLWAWLHLLSPPPTEAAVCVGRSYSEGIPVSHYKYFKSVRLEVTYQLCPWFPFI